MFVIPFVRLYRLRDANKACSTWTDFVETVSESSFQVRKPDVFPIVVTTKDDGVSRWSGKLFGRTEAAAKSDVSSCAKIRDGNYPRRSKHEDAI